jgi:ribosomal protein L11 methylase PrmA
MSNSATLVVQNQFRHIRAVSCKSHGDITDWVIENLESNESSITSASTSIAGENDTLPFDGLCIGNVRILPSDTEFVCNNSTNETTTKLYKPIKLLVGRNGWGTGVHPTTRLCIEWLCHTIQGGETLLDYGCGSGILSITALHMGASKTYGVDIEAEALVTALRNVQSNGYENHHFVPLHTREVLPYGIHAPTGVDICVANILIGQLIRPSMIAALISNIVPGGLLCLSGIRPGDQVETLKSVYSDHIEWIMEDYMELSASDTPSSIDSYGFDCGTWCRLVGRKVSTRSRSDDINSMSDLAVS